MIDPISQYEKAENIRIQKLKNQHEQMKGIPLELAFENHILFLPPLTSDQYKINKDKKRYSYTQKMVRLHDINGW